MQAAVPGSVAGVAAGLAKGDRYWTREWDSVRIDRFLHAAATDPGGGVVEFGGRLAGAGGPTSADTVVWKAGTWTKRSPAHSPPSREQAAMAADGAGNVILFGGVHSEPGKPLTTLNDTWRWDGTDWTELKPATSPPARTGAAMAADGQGRLVLFGGAATRSVKTSADLFGDTWVWDGSTWTRRAPAHSPRPTWYLPAATARDGSVLLYAGRTTWTWDGSDWASRSSVQTPGSRFGHGMARDGNGDVILVGGDLGDPTPPRTWRWDGSQWHPVRLADHPTVSSGAVAATAEGIILNRSSDFEKGAKPHTWQWRPFDGVIELSGSWRGRGSAGRQFGTPVEIHPTDTRGVRLADVPVTFTLPARGPGANFAGGALTAAVLSDVKGVATAPPATLRATLGSWKATATSPVTSSRVTMSMETMPPPVYVVAAVGTDRALRVRRSTASRWTNLGGRLYSAPVVVRSSAGTVYYIAAGGGSRLWVRTDARAWKQLTTFACREPGAAFDGNHLTVGCRTTDNRYGYSFQPVAPGALPATTDWMDVVPGRTMRTGPAVAGDLAAAYVVRFTAGSDGPNVSYFDNAKWHDDPDLRCESQPSLARATDGSGATVCLDAAGAVQWTGEFSPPTAVGGKLSGVPAAVTYAPGDVLSFFGQAGNRVWVRTVSGMAPGRWTNLGGSALYGVGATMVSG